MKGSRRTVTAALSGGLQQRGEFSRAMILTDSPTIPLVFKLSTISLHALCEG